jgi:hypothetical protein
VGAYWIAAEWNPSNDTLSRCAVWFIACPRGYATLSIRPFETLKAGRVPIIVADSYVAPEGLEAAGCMLLCRKRYLAQFQAFVAAQSNRRAEMVAKTRRSSEDT